VTTWYDVTDLMNWSLPHLTGIQRTTVGILNGLVARGARPRLTAFDKAANAFVAVNVSELPPTIRRHFPWLARHPAVPVGPEPAAPEPPPGALDPAVAPPRAHRRWITRERFFGASPEAQDLRVAFRAHKTSARQLRRTLGRWAWVRSREALGRRRRQPGPPVLLAPAQSTTRPTPPIAAAPPGPFASGDVLFSLGASWIHTAHAPAVARARARGVRVVRLIYDLIPTLKPQWVDDVDRGIMISGPITQWARRLITESDVVLTISEFSKQEIARYCAESGLDSAPVAVIRLGDMLEAQREPHPPLPQFVPRRPFFLCVSSLDVRKNHRLLYEAWGVLAARGAESCPDLVCVGSGSTYIQDLVREIRNDRDVNRRIHLLKGVEDLELDWYYRNCTATIYPSKYEGWGLPVAESLCHGRLCLASNATSIPEISPDLPEFFDPHDVHGLVALVRRSLDDPDWVRHREAEIRRGFVPTPWTVTAGQVLAAVASPSSAQTVGAA
jgi:glycosyltransferase involved in cell wall biosynthesis